MRLTLSQRLRGHVPDPSPPVQSVTPRPHFATWDLTRWHASPEHITYARDLFADVRFQVLLSVLTNARPSAVTRDPSPTSAAIALGRREGFDLLLGIIEQLPQFPVASVEDVPATYGAEDFNIDQTT